MPRDTSPYTVGDFWLDKRRDGASPDIWQIARYAPGSRSVVYRSTRTGDLARAKAAIHAYDERERAKGRQDPQDARVIPVLQMYWDERGREAINKDQTRRSLRTFIAFLEQDSAGLNAVVTDMVPQLFERFRRWRMGRHAFDIAWAGSEAPYASDGVSGDTVARNINDIRAAINHAAGNMRLPYAPKIGTVEQKHLNPLRERVLSLAELGRICWYVGHYPALARFVALQIATAVRPDVAKVFDPTTQYDDRVRLIDLHPAGKARTKKRNAIVPAIRPLQPVLRSWARDGHQPVGSHKTAWRIMRRALGLSPDVHAKTIRHTIATMLYADPSVPERQVSELLGHEGKLHRTTRLYAKYDPAYLAEAKAALTSIWLAIRAEARRFGADHLLTSARDEKGRTLAREVRKV